MFESVQLVRWLFMDWGVMQRERTCDLPDVQGRLASGLTGWAVKPVSASDRSTEDSIAAMPPQTCEYSPEVFEWLCD